MKRALAFILVLAAALVVALVIRVQKLRAADHGPAGGTGTIEGVDVGIVARIAARITKEHAREGDTVKQGDLLVELDCADQEAALDQARSFLAAADASLDVALDAARSAARNASAGTQNVSAARSQEDVLRAQEALARVELERTERLVAQGAVAQAALDDARARHLALLSQIAGQRAIEGMFKNQADALASSGSGATKQVVAAENTVKASRASVARAEVAVKECKLYAPRGGIVTSRNLEPGEAVLPGSVILTITNLFEARTRFYLANDLLAFAAPGKKVRVVADAYPATAFEGTIYYISPRAEFTPRNVQTREDRERLVYAVEVRIPNDDARLRSGMPVEVSIEGSWK